MHFKSIFNQGLTKLNSGMELALGMLQNAHQQSIVV